MHVEQRHVFMVRFFFSPLKSQPTSHPTDRFFRLFCVGSEERLKRREMREATSNGNVHAVKFATSTSTQKEKTALLSTTSVRNTAKWHAICPFVLLVAVASFSLPKPDCTRQIIVRFSGKDRLNAHIPRMVLHFRVGMTCEAKSWMHRW